MDSQVPIQEWNQYTGLFPDVGLTNFPFQAEVLDTAPVPTRAGLYVFINSTLQTRPAFEDAMVTDLLNSRYGENVTDLVVDLILTSFDVLFNTMYRNEPSRVINLFRSFLVNRVPTFILNNYAAMIFEPLSVENCIRQALSRLDPSAFPSGSNIFDPLGRNSMLAETRQEFLFACALHQLIPERSIEEILEEIPMQSLPAGGRYLKEDLVRQCTSGPAKIEEYIAELENMEGNAGEIAAAITEILHILCANNDTMTLKTVCSAICRKISALDIMLLFTRPETLLKPICHLLDNWQDHDDQGEYQPVYDEFGSILLFIAVIQHRFTLPPDELGIDDSDSFLLTYLRHASMSQTLDNHREHNKQVLGSWIKGLFETEGISDELMSACKPKEFHLLVATLFDQSVKACQAQILAPDTLRGGFEYFLQPFLLPSLVAGFTWFSHCLWEINDESKNVDAVMLALQALLKPPSMSQDSSAIHNAVLSIVAKPLADSLNHVHRVHPSRPDINPLLTVLNPHTQDQRQSAAALNELTSWSATPNGSLLTALRQTIQTLILWSANTAASADSTPPSYTHAQLLNTISVLGSQPVLTLLLDEANNNTQPNTTDLALDLITVMIYTASTPHLQTPYMKNQRTLREALSSHFTDVEDLSRTDPARAQIIVRLYRRVETLMVSKTGAVAGPGGADAFMEGVETQAEGMPTANIDDVLGEAEEQIASAQGLLAANNASLLGLA